MYYVDDVLMLLSDSTRQLFQIFSFQMFSGGAEIDHSFSKFAKFSKRIFRNVRVKNVTCKKSGGKKC